MSEEHKVLYSIEVRDGISQPMKNAEEQLKKTDTQLRNVQREQDKTILKSVETLAALHAIQSGVSATTNAVHTLGLVDEETFKTLQKLTAGIQLVVGAGELIKGVTALWNTYNAVLKTNAIVSTFASIAENPAKGALIIGAAGLATGAVAGYLYSATQNNNTTINVAHTETARQAETMVDTGTWY